MKNSIYRNLLNSLLVLFTAVLSNVKGFKLQTDVKRLRYMSPNDYKRKYGINVKGVTKPSKFFSSDSSFLPDEEEDLYLGVQGTTGQYPIFMERLFLTGSWLPNGKTTI